MTQTYPRGFERIYDCPAGRRILRMTRHQPARITRASDGAIDWTAPHSELDQPAGRRGPPTAACPEYASPTTSAGRVDCDCPGAENGGDRTEHCQACGTTVYTTRHTEPTSEENGPT
ncbi:hypothetical protein [Cumulibacter manganitolerans]|uniref:hypothetical protein n=1 Tax=Cumulibacter manganitolerans TaxID=1884992 RepID=UPI0012948D1B|nr:hypothetical protein [Cumulibacter manganitolerans]